MATAINPETAVHKELQDIIADFRVKYPQSQKLRLDLESFLSSLELLDEKIPDEQEELEQPVSKIEDLLGIENLENGVLGIGSRLRAIAGELEAGKDNDNAEDLANVCSDIILRRILVCGDIDLRNKIEAFAKELANYEHLSREEQESFEVVVRTRINCA